MLRSVLRVRPTHAAALSVLAMACAATGASAAAGPLQVTGKFAVPASQVGDGSFFATPSIIGDFNRDGLDDQVIARDRAVTIVFGSRTQRAVDLDNPGAAGLRMVSPSAVSAVGGAGDFDRDGYDDLVVGAAGRTYVVYGAASGAGTTLQLAAGPRVTELSIGPSPAPEVGGIGDFDGDGYDDIATSYYSGLGTEKAIQGVSLVRGGPRVGSINAAVQGARSSLVSGFRTCSFSFVTFKTTCSTKRPNFSALGDFNGDGKSDVYVGSGRVEDETRTILLGRGGTFSAQASSPGSVNTVGVWAPMRGMGDANGDGLGDAIVGKDSTGFSVLLGRRSPAASLPATTPVIGFTGSRESLGTELRPAGDQNGDGLADLLIGTNKVRVVSDLPASAPATVNIDPLTTVTGFSDEDQGAIGFAFGGAGDVDGDGADDLIATDTYQDRIVRLTHGADLLAPELEPRDPVYTARGVAITPARFTRADGAQFRIPLQDAATVELKYRKVVGFTWVGTEVRALPVGRTQFLWKGTINGNPMAPGAYLVDVTPYDAAGNRGRSQRSVFEILPATG